jgi:hypothetical protein
MSVRIVLVRNVLIVFRLNLVLGGGVSTKLYPKVSGLSR